MSKECSIDRTGHTDKLIDIQLTITHKEPTGNVPLHAKRCILSDESQNFLYHLHAAQVNLPNNDTYDLTIRLVETEAGFEIVQKLVREYQNSLPFIIDWEQFEDELAQIDVKYSDPDGLFLLAKKGNLAVGCVGLRQLSNDICELKRMYVLPEMRGEGIGRRMLSDVIEMAKLKGYKLMRLDTTTDLKAAISLYRTFGFYEIPRYNSNPLPNVLFFEVKL